MTERNTMHKLHTWAWWSGALERAGSQAAEATLAVMMLGGTLVLTDLDWRPLAAYALGGAVWSIATSIASLPEHGPRAGVPRWRAILFRLIRTLAAALASAFALAATQEGLFDVFAFDWVGQLDAIALIVVIAAVKLAIRRPPEAVTT